MIIQIKVDTGYSDKRIKALEVAMKKLISILRSYLLQHYLLLEEDWEDGVSQETGWRHKND